MSEYLGKSFDQGLRQLGRVIIVVIVVLLVAAFFLGRCSAKYEVRTPVAAKV